MLVRNLFFSLFYHLSETIFKKGAETTHFQKLARGHEGMQAENVFLESYRQCTRKLSLDLNSPAHELYFHFSFLQFNPPHDRILLIVRLKGLR